MQHLKRIVNLLIYGGTTRLNKLEQRLLAIGREAMPKPWQPVFDQQLQRLQRVKHYNNKRMITFQFDGATPPLFENRAPELTLLTFELNPAKGQRKSKPLGAVISHRGKLSSLELRTPLRELSEADWERICAKYLGENLNIAREIDSEEHGPEQAADKH